MKHLPALATLSLIGLVGLPTLAQSRSEKVDRLTSALAGAANEGRTEYTSTAGQQSRATPAQLMRQTLANVDYDQMPGRLALEAWSVQTGVPMVVNWAALENAGIDQDTPVTLKLSRVPADQVLRLIVQQLNPDPLGDDDTLILDVQQWYVRVITKREALRKSVTRMYFIGDLLMTIPNFDNAPKFDLNDALSNTSSGGSNGRGGGGSGQGLFGNTNDTQRQEPRLSKTDQAEQLADIIRNSIEPDIWQANGGEYASVRYYRGMLVVKAPEFVHEQIGIPVVGDSGESRATTTRSSDNAGGYRFNDDQGQYRQRRSSSGNVAGTAPSSPRLVR